MRVAQKPVWSVMVPMYNPNPRLLRECLQSVVSQNFPADKMQILVLDDASPTCITADWLGSTFGERIGFHREPENLGLARIWNRCIELADGEFVHILHQDDLVADGFYDRLGRLLTHHPSAGAAFCRHGFLNASGIEVGESELLQGKSGPLEQQIPRIFSKQIIQCASVVVRKTTYGQVGGYNGSFVYALDWEMWMRIASCTAILYEPTKLAWFRVHDASQSSRLEKASATCRDIRAVIEHCGGYVDGELRIKVHHAALLHYMNETLRKAFGHALINKFPEAITLIREAWGLAPNAYGRAHCAVMSMKILIRSIRSLFASRRPV